MHKLGWLLIVFGALMLFKGGHFILPLLFAPLFFWPFFVIPFIFMMGARRHHSWQHGHRGGWHGQHGCGGNWQGYRGGCGPSEPTQREEPTQTEPGQPTANTGDTVRL